MRLFLLRLSSIAFLCTATGCASGPQGNNYAYAPPYAPSVYPQAASTVQPTAYNPSATMPAGAIPASALPPGAIIASGPAVGSPVTAPMNVGAPVVNDGSGQTPPCPPIAVQ